MSRNLNVQRIILALVLVSVVVVSPMIPVGNQVKAENSEDKEKVTGFYSVEDTYIQSGSNSNVNYGDARDLQVSRGNREAFLKFDFSSYTHSYAQKAKLRIYAENRTGNFPYHKLNVFGIEHNTWSESELTWDNAPRNGGTWLDVLDVFDSEGWYEIDVTDYVNKQIADQDYKVAFRVENETTSSSRPAVHFSSREAESHHPELILEAPDSNGNKPPVVEGEDGYELWLRYHTVSNPDLLNDYRESLTEVVVEDSTEILDSAKEELVTGLSGLLDQSISASEDLTQNGAVVIGTPGSSSLIASLQWDDELEKLGDEGFIIRSAELLGKRTTVIASKTDQGVLYGAFQLLKRIQSYKSISDLDIYDMPVNELRMLNHWDDWIGTVERGYAGKSLWQWDELPDTISPRYKDYARANASLGINSTVINSVNATDHFIRTENLPKIAALADVFRSYGIQVYLSLRYDSPMTVGGLDTADPLDPEVIQWWEDKVDEIYDHIPDFGGFLVKGDSEGQPGPLQYGRTHAEGANMLADVLKPHDGIVIWRAFVYGVSGLSPDRYKQAYELFEPMDGEFAENVIIQSKNGPFDFQTREPVAPLFGALPNTNTGIELQITQEYTGQSTHSVWLVPQWKEVLDFDTKANGEGSTVKRVVDGTLFNYDHSLFAGVANIGLDRNWTRDYLGQANWYGFGRLAWNPDASSEEIADEWVRMTYNDNQEVINSIKSIYESYTSPLGLGIVTDAATHFKPYISTRENYHRSDASGVGYDRTRTGSGYTEQYHPEIADQYDHLDTAPEELLLQLHHVPYTYELSSGKSVIQYLYDSYFDGVTGVQDLINEWKSLKGLIDDGRYAAVLSSLERQLSEAIVWGNLGARYFHNKSGIPDKEGRENHITRPIASVDAEVVMSGGEITTAQSSKPGTIYILPENRANAGEFERKTVLDLGADSVNGNVATVEAANVETTIKAPEKPGTYKLYAVDEYGNVSDPSANTILITDNKGALKDIKVNGESLEDFDPNHMEYDVNLPIGTTELPVVEASSLDPSAVVTINQATSAPGTAVIIVTADDGTKETYTLHFHLKTVLQPEEDTYVRAGAYADNNYKDTEQLQVKLDGALNNNRMSFLKFNLDQDDIDTELDRVKLRLYVDQTGQLPNKTINIYGISEEWNENEITWNNAPRTGGILAGSMNVSTELGWYEFDITEYVKDHLMDETISFRLESETSHTSGHVFYSSSKAMSNQPELILSAESGMVSVEAIQDLLEDFIENGDVDDNAAHALKIHLIAVERFEKQETADKVVKHMNGFKLLLDHQKDNGMISEEAYDTLKANSDSVIKRWQ